MAFSRTFLLSIFFCLMVASLAAQQFGGNPASIKCQQINTDSFRIIFPDNISPIAESVAALIKKIPSYTAKTIGGETRKVNIVLQNQGLLSNGNVGMGPFRSEFYLTPEQNSFVLGSLPSHAALALHEFRHVQQYNNFRKGVSKVVYAILGEEAGSLMNSLAIPDWFWEGDAVYQETLLSPQGRGRLPFFFNDFRSLWAAGKQYSWMKLTNGSLRDFTPDHYRLGYMEVAYGREKYGAGLWKDITADAVRFRGLLYPFQKAVKRYTGISYTQFRKEAMEYFRKASPVPDTASAVNRYARSQKHFDANELYPQWINENELVFLRSSYVDNPAFYTQNIATGKRSRIRFADISLDNYFSYRNNRIVYSAFEADRRWASRQYQVIRLVDLVSGKQKTITRHTRLFSPDIDSSGNRIIAVSSGTDGFASLVLLEAASGKVVKTFRAPADFYFATPKFMSADTIVTAIRDAGGKMSIALLSLHDGVFHYLLPFSYQPIGFLSVAGDTILFSASYGKNDLNFALTKDALYRFNPAGSSQATGNYQPSMLNGRLAWSVFTAAGYHIFHTEKLTSNELVPLKVIKEEIKHLYPLPSLDTASVNLLLQKDSVQFPVLRYPKSFHLLNFHSLRPRITDPDYSVSLASENILNTMQAEVTAGYNRNEGYKQLGFGVTYGGFFPWIEGGVDYTIDRKGSMAGREIRWNEWQPYAGFTVPLSFTSGKYYRYLDVGSDYVLNKRYYRGNIKDSVDNRSFGYLRSRISWTSQVQQSRQRIYPRFAQSISLGLRKGIAGKDNSQFLCSSYFYFPGVWPAHSAVLSAAYSARDKDDVLFSDNFPFSRGYSAINFRRMYRWGLNYHFPLLYPDAGFGNLLYVLRVRANAFYDFTKVKNESLDRKRIFRSAGIEMYFDTKWWNQQNISFGIRYSRLLDDDILNRAASQWELILPVNLLNRRQERISR